MPSVFANHRPHFRQALPTSRTSAGLVLRIVAEVRCANGVVSASQAASLSDSMSGAQGSRNVGERPRSRPFIIE